MRILFSYIKGHWSEDFRFSYYLLVLVFIGILLYFNYNLNLEKRYLDPAFGKPLHFFIILISFLIGYLGTLAIQRLYFKKAFPADYRFWIALLFILCVEAHDMSFSFHRTLARALPTDIFLLAIRTIKNMASVVTVLLPLYIFHQVTKSRTRFYGLTRQGFDVRPYLVLCGIALTGIAISLVNNDLNSYYPTYKAHMGDYFGEYEWMAVIVYEIFYSLDFVSVEMVFRGFLVIGLARWLGKEAIMPMVTVYCMLHFGKPLPEAISSIFGGYLLGILAYRSKSVLGGVMIHVSIALGMEFFAYIFS